MSKKYFSIIEDTINEINGLSFIDSSPYSAPTKIFFLNRYSEIVNILPKIKPQDVGLEIGLAGGVLAFVLKRKFSLNKLYSLEHPVVVSQYRKEFLAKLKNENILLKSVDLKKGKLPWESNFFDFILLCDVIEHLVPSDIPPIINEIKRVLKKDGYFVLVTPNVASLIKRINLLIGKNPVEFDLFLHEKATYGHIREYTFSEVVQILKNENLILEKKKYFMIDTNRNIFTRVESLASKIFPSLANTIGIVVRK